MTRESYLADLRRALGRMSESEKKDILYDYEEHFRIGAAEGRTDEQIARSLGSPRLLGKSYAIDAILEQPREGGGIRVAAILRAVFASISLGFFNIVIVLGPFLGLVGVMIGLWATAGSLAIAGLGVFLGPLAVLVVPGIVSLGGLSPVFFLFAGIGTAALGVLAVIGMVKLTELFIRATAAYVRLNARIITRRS
jgi:uncharacterized membrane protein